MAADADNQKLSARDEFVEKLKKALRRDGDFPASAKVVAEIRRLASDPTTTSNKITESILQEPTLGTRVLHVVNSTFYRRARPIMTVSQAVVQIGMRPLAELCAGLVLLQKFVPTARKDSSFAKCLKRTITTSILASSIQTAGEDTKTSARNETGYLSGTFYEIGTLLLAFYFPNLFAKAEKRSEQKKQSLARSIQELTGLSPAELSLEVIRELKLPDAYEQAIAFAEDAGGSAKGIDESTSHLYRSLYAAKTLSEALIEGTSAESMERALLTIGENVGFDREEILGTLQQLEERFQSQCQSLDLRLPQFPTFVQEFVAGENPDDEGDEKDKPEPIAQTAEFTGFVDEIREAVEAGEPPASIITTVLEAFAYGLGFNRVLLLLLSPDKSSLHGRMALGDIGGVDPTKVKRTLGRSTTPYDPDAVAYSEGRPVFNGDPIFENGWPFAVIPIGFEERVIGVIYGDFVDSDDQELSPQKQAAVGVLAELLDQSIRRS